MERETKTLTTPLGKEVVMKTYITARERKQYTDDLTGFDAEHPDLVSSMKIAEKFITLVVEKYDGKTEGILDTLLDGRSDEYDYVANEAAKVAKGNFQAAK